MAQAKYGTGSIYQLKNGKWQWQGYYIDDAGKKHRPSKTFNTEAEALLFQANQIDNAEIKRIKKSKDLTCLEVFELWCEDVKHGKIDISETTRKNSIRNWRTHLLPLLGSIKIKSISILQIERYFNKLRIEEGLSERTIYNIYADLLKVVRFALHKEYIYKDPLEGIEKPKPKPLKHIVNVLSFDEYEKIMSNDKNRASYYYWLIMFIAETGLRAEEIAISKTDYIVSDNLSYVIIDKSIVRALNEDDLTTQIIISDNLKNNRSRRKVPLNIFAQNAVEMQLAYCEEHKIESDFIFCTKTGGMLEQRNILRAFHTFCKNADIPIRGLHSLRKLYVNHTLRQGITPFDLAKTMGHSMQTMFKYYHSMDEKLLKQIADASESRN